MSGDAAIEQLVDGALSGLEAPNPPEVRAAFSREMEQIGSGPDTDPRAWASWADGTDVLGEAFERLVSGADRRAAGQFQTPLWAADVMAGWVTQDKPASVLDPGVGSGRLLFRAGRLQSGLALAGIDADPLCVEMARLNLRLRGLDPSEIRVGNFLTDEITSSPGAIICNPPYSRHHAIDPDMKEAVHRGLEDRLGVRFSRLAALHALFLLRSLEVAASGARIAFITPSDWLDGGYGLAVKRFVLERAQVEAIILFEPSHLVFDGALTSAAITLLHAGPTTPDSPGIRFEAGCAGPKPSPGSKPTRVVSLDRELPPIETVLKAVEGNAPPAGVRVREVRLDADQKWSRPRSARRQGTPLSELANVRRGIATGCNRFFVISEETRREWGLPVSELRACITSPKVISGLELTARDLNDLPDDKPRWALDCREQGAEQRDDPLGRYLRYGRDELGAHAGYLASRRTPWYALEARPSAPILFTYMNREAPRFIRNHANAIPLNTFLIIEPRADVDPDRLCAALNRPAALAQLQDLRRNYGGGLWKLEPSELSRVRVKLR